MAKVFVQFADASETSIAAGFGCAQDPEVYPNFAEIDDDDARYLTFLARVEGGGVPSQVTMRQARLALLAAGKLSAVSAAVAGLPSPQKEAAQIEWEFATTVERDSPFLATLATLLKLDAAALDALFTAAAQL